MNEFQALREDDKDASDALAEALRCVEASDFVPIDGELFVSSSSASPSEFQAQETQASLRSSYANKREELRVLRALARQLEARLAVLHGRRSGNPVSRARQSSKATVKSHLWESLATRQFHALEKSESENARLKALVAEQHTQIQSLKRIVMKKQSKMTNDPFMSPVMDMIMEHDLLGMLRGIDRILADSRDPLDPRESLNVANLVATDSFEHPTIEVLISRSFPFEHKAVAGALWNVWSMQPSHPNLRDMSTQPIVTEYDGKPISFSIRSSASTSQTSVCDVLRTLTLMSSVKESHFEPSSSAVVLLKGTEPPWQHPYSSSCWTRTGRPGMALPCA